VFHAVIDDTGPKRLGRTLMLPTPDASALRAHFDRTSAIAARIEAGSLVPITGQPPSPVLDALVQGFAHAAREGQAAPGCVQAALACVGALPASDLPRPPPPVDGTPVLSVTPMLHTASTAVFAGPDTGVLPNEPVDVRLRRSLEAVEALAGASAGDTHGIALSILGIRDEALEAVVPVEPPPMPVALFLEHLDTLQAQLTALCPPPAIQQAA